MTDIAYLEYSTEDRAAVVEYLTQSLGFLDIATCDEPDRCATYLRQGDVRFVVTSGPAVEDYLAAHGDGVSDIALSCADIPAAIVRATDAGARLLGPATLSGFGDVRHTLVPRPGEQSTDSPLPDDRPWIATGSRSDLGRPAFIRELDHLAVLVPSGDLHPMVRFYEDAFGFKQYSNEYVEVGLQAMDSVVVRSGSGKVTFTIIEPDGARAPGQVDGFLQRNGGAGVQHPAFLVEDIITAVRTYRGLGVEFLQTPDAYYARLTERVGHLREAIEDLWETNVLADRDECGYLLQLFTRSPLLRNTMFYEFIQRRSAQGFGSNNIRALYESVEREPRSGA